MSVRSAPIDASALRVAPTYRGFLALARLLGEPVGDWQRRFARAVIEGDAREVLLVVGRGNFKTSTAALLALHHLASHSGASVGIGAASREQAKVLYDRMVGYVEGSPLAGVIEPRTHELRAEATGGVLRVLSGRGERAHGRSDSLMVGDEVWAWPDGRDASGGLLEAFQSGLVKSPTARLALISTPAPRVDSPLGRLRDRALAGTVRRRGPLTEARAPGILLQEYGIADDVALDDFDAIARANPAPYITADLLREQHGRLPPATFGQLHAGRWFGQDADDLFVPLTAWDACRGDAEVPPDSEVVVAVDASGKGAATTAVVWVDRDLRVGCRAFENGLTGADALIDQLATRYRVREVTCDPWHVSGHLSELWESRGLVVSEFPQNAARVAPASQRLRDAVTQRRLVHDGDPVLRAHVAACVTVESRRGWHIGKREGQNNDLAVALLMALDRIAHQPRAARYLGML